MKIQMLPSSIDEDGRASARQHLLTIVIDDCLAIDAGCLAMSCSAAQREGVRDIILTHTHLDHIAGLPLFIDDLFATLREPVRVHATAEMIEILQRDIFNWSIYPRFSELSNEYGPVVEFIAFERGSVHRVKDLSVTSIGVHHPVSANGFVIFDDRTAIAITGDTAETDEFWNVCSSTENLRAVLVECAFPDELVELAQVSEHLTPKRLMREIEKLKDRDYPVYVINLKPMYREKIIEQITAMNPDRVEILEVGSVYEF